VAAITEERRAAVAERAFAVGEKMIDVADSIMEEHPVSSARLLATGVQTISLVAGAARNYNVAAPAVEIVTKFYDKAGNEIDSPSPDGDGLNGESGDGTSNAETRFSKSLSRSSTLRSCPHTDAHRTKDAQKIDACVFIERG
jgi:hypothetical protein